jgi:hypothetical protein
MGDEYWISGVKKNQEDRHWAGSGTVSIDGGVVQEYLNLIGRSSLDSRKFERVSLDNDYSAVKVRIHKIENQPLEEPLQKKVERTS